MVQAENAAGGPAELELEAGDLQNAKQITITPEIELPVQRLNCTLQKTLHVTLLGPLAAGKIYGQETLAAGDMVSDQVMVLTRHQTAALTQHFANVSAA